MCQCLRKMAQMSYFGENELLVVSYSTNLPRSKSEVWVKNIHFWRRYDCFCYQGVFRRFLLRAWWVPKSGQWQHKLHWWMCIINVFQVFDLYHIMLSKHADRQIWPAMPWIHIRCHGYGPKNKIWQKTTYFRAKLGPDMPFLFWFDGFIFY